MGDKQKNHQKKTERGRPRPLHPCRTNKKRRRRRNTTDEGPRTVTKSPPSDSLRKNTEAEGTKERNGRKKRDPPGPCGCGFLFFDAKNRKQTTRKERTRRTVRHETRAGREAKNIQRTRTTKKNHKKNKRHTKENQQEAKGDRKRKPTENQTRRKTTRPRV